jgi:hypothetical protein
MKKKAHSKSFSPQDKNSSTLETTQNSSSSWREIEPFRLANQWFDEGYFNDTQLVQSMNLPVSAFLINSGDIVDGIQALYGGKAIELAPAHGNVGQNHASITLESGDRWSEISGFYGSWFGGLYVLQLTFRTQQGLIYGPFGSMNYAANIQPFCLTIQPDESILALSGVVSFGDNGRNRHLGALGLVLSKDEASELTNFE